MTEIPDTWYPMVLPHVETADGTLRFLGHQVEGYGHLSDRDTALLSRCDGSWPLAGFPEADRETIGRWRRHGLLLMAPPLPPGPPATEPPVIVSPHPDDAALALGGTVARQGARFLDVFSVETWTKDPYYAERPALTRRLLLDEEGVAARVLRARVELLGFVDAADRDLRRDRFFTAPAWSDGSVREEPQLFDALTERLAPCWRAPARSTRPSASAATSTMSPAGRRSSNWPGPAGSARRGSPSTRTSRTPCSPPPRRPRRTSARAWPSRDSAGCAPSCCPWTTRR
ncbi:hypothetical protein F3K43_43705 [Streptomyces sp. LBUM 1476]|nr:hypothetical protein [Streptomyces sp. LBUM 1476]